MDEYVASKLAEWNMTSLHSVFEKHQIDKESLLLLDQPTVRELVEAIGPRAKLWRRIQELQKEQESFQQQLFSSVCSIPVNTSQDSQPTLEHPQGNPIHTVVVQTEGTHQSPGRLPRVEGSPDGDRAPPDTPRGEPHSSDPLLVAIQRSGRFLTSEEVWDTMLTGRPIGRAVPSGVKENAYFLLSFEQDIHSNQNNLEALQVDDLGPWKKNSLKTHHFILDGKVLHYIEYKDGLYCKLLRGSGRIPLDPQPEEEDLVTYRRTYLSLKQDSTHRKRISTVLRCPRQIAWIKWLAVVEYARVYPDVKPVQGISQSSPGDQQVESDNIPVEDAPIPGAMRSNGYFLSVNEILQTMLKCEPSGFSVPAGVKENVYFLLDNEANILRQQNDKRSMWVDDCGAWGRKGSVKLHHYIVVGEKLQYLNLKNGIYTHKYNMGQPLDPQPEECNIWTLRRYYQCLQRDNEYRKRVSTFVRCPEHLSRILNLVLIEYVGRYPRQNLPHGNTKSSTTAYVRKSPSAKRKLLELAVPY